MNLGTSPEDLSYSIFLDRIRQQPPTQGSRNPLDHVRQQHGWVPDSAATHCHLCKKDFNMWRRRHHCRLDGGVYCFNCCSHFIQLPKNLENIPECPQGFRSNQRWDFRFVWSALSSRPAYHSTKERVCNTCYARYLEMKQFEVYILIFGYLDLQTLVGVVTQVCKEWHRAANVCKSIFRDIQYVLPGYGISPIQRRLLWNSSMYLAGHSRWILKFLTYLDWSNPHDVAMAEHMLQQPRSCKCWSLMCTRSCQPQLSGYDWVQLLFYRISSPVAQAAMTTSIMDLSDEDIESFVPQLTFSLKYNNFLLDTLLNKAVQNRHLRTAIYWNLVMLKSRDTSYHPIYNLFMARLHDVLGRQIVFGELIAGRRFIKTLAKMPSKHNLMIDYLRRNGETVPCQLRWKPDDSMIRGINSIPLPLNTDLSLVAIDVFGIKAKDSVSSPMVIPLRCEHHGQVRIQSILYKPECLIQDSIIIAIIRLMDRLLKRDLGIDFGIRTYRVLPLDGTSGIIEMVENSETLYAIKYQMNFTLQNYLLEHNPTLPVSELRDRFIKSAAAYCVISYLLGVGDRHMDNIMITRDGYLFHIDYGYILGHDPKPLTPAMRITQDIVDVMGGESSKDFQTFRQYCTAIYNCLRKYTSIFMSMLLLMTEDGLSLDLNKYQKDRLKEEILSRFVPSETAQEAETQLLIKIDDSYRSYTPRMFIDFWHYHSKETLSRIFS